MKDKRKVNTHAQRIETKHTKWSRGQKGDCNTMQVHASSNPAGVSGGRRPDKKNPQHDSVRDAHALAKKRR